ncbi:MAG: hypothetical protein LKH53_09260, partial [Prevotella sp.]|nr:hypothetical protein [Prevotella sp.]
IISILLNDSLISLISLSCPIQEKIREKHFSPETGTVHPLLSSIAQRYKKFTDTSLSLSTFHILICEYHQDTQSSFSQFPRKEDHQTPY